jgi:hypothetical protein
MTNIERRAPRKGWLLAIGIVVGLAAGAPALAQRGGHGGGGGGSHGGYHGGSGGSHGSYSGGYRGAYHGSSFRGYWGGGFRGGFRYRPYYWWGPLWGWNWGWGYPFYSSWWWWGGPWYGPAGYVAVSPGDGYGYGAMRRFAAVKTDVRPEEAEVWLDGKYIGAADDFDGTPDYLYLKPGKYHLDFKTPGWEEYGVDLSVKAGEFNRNDHQLKRLPGTPKLAEFPKYKGMPYGRVFGTTGPVAAEEMEGDRGRRSRERDADTDRSYDQDSDRPPSRGEARMDDEDQPRPSHSASKRARLRFKVTPEDAAVYVDDKYVGAADDLSASPRGMVTDPGAHQVTVVRPGYKSRTIDVTARAGAAVDVVVDLEK